MTKFRQKTSTVLFLSGLLISTTFHTESVQAQINIQQAVNATCAVMAGQQKPDRQTQQYLALLSGGAVEGDFADANPVAQMIDRQVLKQCPRAYLNFQHRKRVRNPFPPGALYNPNPTQLYTPGSILTEQQQPSPPSNQNKMAQYDEAIRLNPNNVKAYSDRGNARLEQQDYQGAIADYSNIIRLKPNDPKGYANRGFARKDLGDKKGAISDLQIALRLFQVQGDKNAYQKTLGWLRETQRLP